MGNWRQRRSRAWLILKQRGWDKELAGERDIRQASLRLCGQSREDGGGGTAAQKRQPELMAQG